MRLLGPEDGCKQADVGGVRYNRQADGTFHVNDAARAKLLKQGDFTEARTNLTGVTGYRCGDCGFLAVFRDVCGRCGGTELAAE